MGNGALIQRGKSEKKKEIESKESKLGSNTWEKATGPGYQYENRQGKKEVVEDVEKKEKGRQIKRLKCIEGHILLKGIHKNTAILTFL